VRFAAFHHGDPLSETLWSAIPLNVVRTLREMGHEVEVIGNLTPSAPLIGRLKTQFYKRLKRQIYLINRDPAMIAARAQSGNERLKKTGQIDAILVTYPPDAAYIETEFPILILHDAAWVQLVDFYPGFESSTLARETIQGGIQLDKKALTRCSHAIYSSHWATGRVASEYGIPASKLSVAALGASIVNVPQREDVRRYLEGRGHGPMKLFFLGWEWYRKGGDIAVSVAAEIKALGVPVELHVAGCTPREPLPDWVKVHGPLRKDNPQQAAILRNLFESCDFFILPTRADAFGIVYGEAAAFGVPSIASNVGGVPEAVNGEWGITLPLDSPPRAFAEWAVNLYNNRAEYERVAWLARESYETRLNWPAFCNHVVEIAAACNRPGNIAAGLSAHVAETI